MREPPDPVSHAQYNNVKTKNKTKNAMSRNPRVCPAQINVWCCAAGGSYSSQCGNDPLREEPYP